MVGFDIQERTMPKLLINIGSLLDIPTGTLITGRRGETIINGGLGPITAVVGPGNSFKSTILHYMMLSAADKIYETTPTIMSTYDTEVNISLDRLNYFASKHKNLPQDPTTSGVWSVTDKSIIMAESWAEKMNAYVEAKDKDKSATVTFESMTDPYTKKELVAKIPTFAEIDSLTEFEGSSTADMLTGNLDGPDTNTYAMKQGLFKTKFLSTLPRLSGKTNFYILLTAHIGTKIDMATGPAQYNRPTRTLQYLKGGDSLKGVSTKFTFLTHNAWFANSASVLKNQTTKAPEYPYDKNDTVETDLNLVKLSQLRSKNGPSGVIIELVISQLEGVLPSLSEFHFIKENGRFGISGSNVHYHLDLRPDISLSRTTVRNKLDNDSKLERAVGITADMLQLSIYHQHLTREDLICTPKELYEDIKALGYDWEVLLNTRRYWTIDQYTNKTPFLSTPDLLKIRKGLYFPYFLNEDKTLKKEYIKG